MYHSPYFGDEYADFIICLLTCFVKLADHSPPFPCTKIVIGESHFEFRPCRDGMRLGFDRHFVSVRRRSFQEGREIADRYVGLNGLFVIGCCIRFGLRPNRMQTGYMYSLESIEHFDTNASARKRPLPVLYCCLIQAAALL